MIKVGIYIDSENIKRGGGYGLQYGVLANIASLGPCKLIRANSYSAEDTERVRSDKEYRDSIESYYTAVRRSGFRIVKKPVKFFHNDDGTTSVKANADMELAIDAMIQSKHLDLIYLVTGDGDFVRLIVALQNNGCRVEVIGFNDVSRDLKEAADYFHSGFLIPGLLPQTTMEAGLFLGSVAFYNNAKGYGKLQYCEMGEDCLCSRDIFFHVSHLVDRNDEASLQSPSSLFSFSVKPNDRCSDEFMATNIKLAINTKGSKRQ